MSKTCYMCEKDATSREHVPPKCLFPKKKDLHKGANFKKRLITVPSCDEHNSKKSTDDEYLLYVLAISASSNDIGQNVSLKKVMRAIDRKPYLASQLLLKSMDVFIQNTKTSKIDKSIAIKVDRQRVNSALEHLSRGLFFHHFGTKWYGTVLVRPNFLFSMSDGFRETNNQVKKTNDRSEKTFSTKDIYGENPDVFKYNAVDEGPNKEKFMRLYFYNGSRVTVVFR